MNRNVIVDKLKNQHEKVLNVNRSISEDMKPMIEYKRVMDKNVFWMTVATKPHPNLNYLLERSKEFDLNINVLGMGDKRFQEWGKGFGLKLLLLHRFLKDIIETFGNNDDSIVIFTDAYDILPLADYEEIIGKYLSMNSEIVFGSEVFCHPDKGRAGEYDARYPKNKYKKYKFLNGGCYMGNVRKMLEYMDKYPYEIASDDQGYWTTIFLKNYAKNRTSKKKQMVLDTDAEIFMCMADAIDDIQLIRENENRCRFLNKLTNSNPSMLHFNGTVRFFDQTVQKMNECKV